MLLAYVYLTFSVFDIFHFALYEKFHILRCLPSKIINLPKPFYLLIPLPSECLIFKECFVKTRLCLFLRRELQFGFGCFCLRQGKGYLINFVKWWANCTFYDSASSRAEVPGGNFPIDTIVPLVIMPRTSIKINVNHALIRKN